MKTLLISTLLFALMAQAETNSNKDNVFENCGKVTTIVLETKNPENEQLMVTLKNKKDSSRVSIPKAMASRSETMPLLLQSLNSDKFDLCIRGTMASGNKEKEITTLGLAETAK